MEDQWAQFKEEPRNLKLGLATDGVDPYSLQQSKYSVWPVVVLNYNLPPHLTMNNAFMWLHLSSLGEGMFITWISIYNHSLMNCNFYGHKELK